MVYGSTLAIGDEVDDQGVATRKRRRKAHKPTQKTPDNDEDDPFGLIHGERNDNNEDKAEADGKGSSPVVIGSEPEPMDLGEESGGAHCVASTVLGTI